MQRSKRLHEAKRLLSSVESKSGKKSASKGATVAKKRAKLTLSPEARAKIADAQRKRWAAVKKSTKK
jgi:hypothetical protein